MNMNTLIKDDEELMNEYKEFEELLDECKTSIDETKEKSKWIIRFEA